MTTYGNTLTISSKVNSTDLDSETSTEKTFKSLCEHNTECDTTLFCIYGTCQCAQMHYWNGNICVSIQQDSKFYIAEKFDGDFCRSSIACADNMECRDSICQCSESEYRDNSKCTAKKSVNDACVKQRECGITLYCARSVCQCASSDYWAGSKCLIKKDENAFCNSSLECKVTLQCKRNHCICCEQDFWNGQLCEKKVCVIEKCLNGGRCQISNKRDQCVCAEGYLGDRCQYADGKEKDFVVIFQQAYGTPSPRILPTANRRGNYPFSISLIIEMFQYKYL
ncbi:unnamed protein product [Mytilus edulis]|uniref:EGF-like domain-containing protein n=1 Tax=Mytilus edulis TaxID=6550 RepID=A0A8S3QS20_MYTED|nr:unnamed protein product [Mytilus edulis]